jgi:hypothetical protein
MPDINLSPYTAESAAIARKMRLAEALQQQALSPLEMPTMAGVPISPYAGLAKMLQAYSASRMRGKAEEREKTLADTARADTSADFGALLKGLTPTAAVPEGPSTFTANVDQRDIAENPRMVMQPERNEMNEIIQPGEAGAGNFGITPGTPAIPASAGRLTAEGFGAMKTPAGQQQYMAQLLAQMKPKEPIKLGKDDVLLDPDTKKLIYQPEARANFGSINPSQYTPESVKAFMASGGKDFSLLRTPPAAPPAPTDIAKLIKERDLLPVGSPNRVLYDREIADRGAAAENARKRLAFDQNKFNWEKANPGFEIREADDGSVVGVNKRTLQAFPVSLGGGVAPTAGGSGMPSAQVPAPQAPLAGATPSATRPLMGKVKEAPVKFNDTDLQLSGLAGSLKDFKEEVSKNVFTGAKYLPTGEDTARMTGKYTALLMGVKDLYTLGALTGPDMSIIESQLTNPASWSGKFKTKAGFEAQIKVVEDMLNRSSVNLENSYGRVPKATKKALEKLSSSDSGEWKVVK